MKHKRLHSSLRGFVVLPTSSLYNRSSKMLCPLLPTHPHQSVRAAYSKYYSNPLMLDNVWAVLLRDERGVHFLYMCSCVFTESLVFMHACLSVHAFLRYYRIFVHAWACGCMCANVLWCIWLLLSFLQPPALALSPPNIHRSVWILWAEWVYIIEVRCQILYKCSSHSFLMIVHHFHS